MSNRFAKGDAKSDGMSTMKSLLTTDSIDKDDDKTQREVVMNYDE